jgi:hypothetical protein
MKHEISKTTNALMLGREKISRGWCQGRLHAGDSVCMIGAIAGESDSATYAEARNALALACFGKRWRSPIIYNDAPGRTKEEVLAKFDEAIVLSMA